ncbi:MAG: serine/threonine-protein kinase [Myxococcota bacterium]|nr:serine/threonine-protein kinase [Myxococcota bacterium]
MPSATHDNCLSCGARLKVDAKKCDVCGAICQEPDEPPEAWIGRTVDGKYTVESILGVGGMGMVFEATRVLVGDQVAVKVLYPRLLSSALQRELFRDEAIASARLSHPNVVTVFDTGLSSDTGNAYIAMELLRGRTLKELLREQAPMPYETLLPIALEICEGLHTAHSAQIIHRDLKPDNIYLEQIGNGQERVKLVDFGIAAMLDVERGERRQRLGTLRYMSPEQCRGEDVDARADLYALGVLLYEGLTRRRVTGKSISAVCEDIPQLPNVILEQLDQIPSWLEDLLMRLLAKSPDARPSSALEVMETIRRGSSGSMTLEQRHQNVPHLPVQSATVGSASGMPSLALTIAIGLGAGLLWGFLQ